MPQAVLIRHSTRYRYDRPVMISEQEIRLKPVAHCPVPVLGYKLTVLPETASTYWKRDEYGNDHALVYVPHPVSGFDVNVDLTVDLGGGDFASLILNPEVQRYPFIYESSLRDRLAPFLKTERVFAPVEDYLLEILRTLERDTVGLVMGINRKLWADIGYVRRLEPGVQSARETLEKRQGSCRDSTWLAVQIFRQLGIAARFVSGYLVEIKSDADKSILKDSVDLHAWTEVYLPGAGWVGLDSTSGLLAGRGHIPLACSAYPSEAGPVKGLVDPCKSKMEVSMELERVVAVADRSVGEFFNP